MPFGEKMDSVCQMYHSESHKRTVQGYCDQEFIGHVNKVVAENDWSNVSLGPPPKVHICLHFQVRDYKKEDNPKQQHKVLSPKLYHKGPTLALTTMDLAKEHIICGAVFFVCCSCEYTKVGGR